ncbi:MAG: choloylglycine hydrolase family protein [Proteobacteria bacterium]|nr:choloylglycine hydrolase family protein [Pseudomonadota bacterium]
MASKRTTRMCALVTLIGLTGSVLACTGIRIKAKDDAVVSARTMEFAQDLESTIIYIPKGVNYVGTTKLGEQNGKKWDVKYAIAGVSGFHLPHILDGINTQGLSFGLFYFPNYAEYPALTKQNQDKSLAPWELGTYLLSRNASVDEVLADLKNVNVVSASWKEGMEVPACHYIVHDKTGKSLVIEYVNGKLTTYDNKLGVITNAPTFDWHMTNLSNYVNLSVNNVPPVDFSETDISGFGQGTGMLGLPGDFTPPSRFVRAVVFTQASVPTLSGEEGIFHAFHILNQFDIPKGAVRNKSGNNTQIEYTQWTAAGNLKEKKYYYHTYYHRDVHQIDLMNMDQNIKKVEWYPMTQDVGKSSAS